MVTTTHRRLLMPLLGLGAAVTLLAGCGSDTTDGSPQSSTPSTSQSSSQSSSSAETSGTPATSENSSPSTAESSSEAGGSRSVAAFCAAYDLDVVKNAGTDPQAAVKVLAKVKDVAPEAIRADAEYIYNALNDALGGKTGDISKITDASANVARYFAQNCS